MLVLHVLRQADPRMLPRLPDGDPRRRKGGIREGADGYGNQIGLRLSRVVDRRAAVGAEVEVARLPRVGDPDVLAAPAFDAHPLGREPRLEAERASRPALTREAMAHGDADRLALRPKTELLAAAGGVVRSHAAIVRDRGARFRSTFPAPPGGTGAPVPRETTERPNWFPRRLCGEDVPPNPAPSPPAPPRSALRDSRAAWRAPAAPC